MTNEARLFGGMAVFGLVVGGAYVFLTGDQTGGSLLGAFGVGAAVASLAIFRGTRPGPSAPLVTTAQPPPGETTGKTERFPAPGWAPLGAAVGLAAIALGLSLGPWLIIVGVLVGVVAASAWVSGVMADSRDRGDDLGR